MQTYIPYILATGTGGIIGAAASYVYNSLRAVRMENRAKEAELHLAAQTANLQWCRNAYDNLKNKNEELCHDRAKIQAERDKVQAECAKIQAERDKVQGEFDTYKKGNAMVLIERQELRDAVKARDEQIIDLKVRIEDADRRRIAAESKAATAPAPKSEPVEKQGELQLDALDGNNKKTEELIIDFLSKHPGEWKTILEISEAANCDTSSISTTLCFLYWKWKIKKAKKGRAVVYKLETESPKTWEDVFSHLPDSAIKFLKVLRENPKKWLSAAALSKKTRYSISAIIHAGIVLNEIDVIMRKTKGNFMFYKLNPNFPTK